MRTLLLLFSTVSFFSFGNDLPPRENTYSYDHLMEINKNWQHWKTPINSEKVAFNSDRERIQYHLFNVIELLEKNTKNYQGLPLKNRLDLVESLRGYAYRGVFPTNHYHSTRRPYFVDNFGVHCAVGYLIAVSGNEKLVENIRKEHNYDYIKDIKTEGVTDWAKIHGFSIEELKLIQPGYQAPRTLVSVGNGTNGEVKKIELSPSNSKLIFSGNFTEVNDLPCLNLGVLQNNQLSCYGNGIDGIVNDFSNGLQDTIYVVGEFNHNGTNFPIVKMANGFTEYISIPSRANAVGKRIFTSNYYPAQKIEVAITSAGTPNQSEVWELNFGTTNSWTLKYTFNGELFDMKRLFPQNAYAGYFSSVDIHNGTTTTSVTSKNVFLINPNDSSYTQIDANVSDTVYSINKVGNNVYFAGAASIQPTSSGICLSKLENGGLVPAMNLGLFSNPAHPVAVHSVHYTSDNEFLIGGRFRVYNVMDIGFHFLKYDIATNMITPLGTIDKDVNQIIGWGTNTYVVGKFESSNNTPVKYIAKYERNLAVVDAIEDNSITIFPNPFSDKISVEGVAPNSEFQLVQMNGQLMREGKLENGKISKLEDLPKGIYLLKISTESGQKTVRLTK